MCCLIGKVEFELGYYRHGKGCVWILKTCDINESANNQWAAIAYNLRNSRLKFTPLIIFTLLKSAPMPSSPLHDMCYRLSHRVKLDNVESLLMKKA